MARKPKDEPPRQAGLSPEDRALWEHVTRAAKPLKRRAPVAPKATPAPPPPESKAPATAKAPPGAAAAAVPTRPPKPAPPELSHGAIAGVDKRSAERLRRGQLRIEASLDLHGHTQAAAHRALGDFLARAQGSGKRCVLVVTGKGTTKEAAGVLRAQVPRWLNEPVNRARVLAFDYALPRDGGMGALYILLRKARDG